MKNQVLLRLTLGVALAASGCQSQDERDAAQRHQMEADTAVLTVFRDLNDQQHKQYVIAANQLYGDRTSLSLALCYSDGYDNVQNEDHTFRNDKRLGPKYVARCDKIRKSLDRYFDEASQAHEKETTK